MCQTITEKILSEHSGKRAKAGDVVISKIDFCLGHDITGNMIIDSLRRIGIDKLYDKNMFAIVLDHYAPSPTMSVSGVHEKIRRFSRENGVKVFDVGSGICHQIIPEKGYVTCGDVIIGADSHTCTYGALNAFSTGVGATDLAIAITSGKSWFRVPETMKIMLNGDLPRGVYAKDVILNVIADLKIASATYKAIEFYGDVIDEISVESRFTIANMAAELGAKASIMKADKKVLEWVKRHSVKEPNPIEADQDAKYCEIKEYDCSLLSPKVACPHSVDNVKNVEEVLGVAVDQVFIGTCANGRLEDIEVAAKILKGKKVKDGLKLIVTPASKKIYLDSIKKGYVETIIKAGGIINNPGCGPCVGTHQGVLADGEVSFSTSNRNFKGKMGNPNSSIYLGSPATAAATALEGVISDPREHKRRLL